MFKNLTILKFSGTLPSHKDESALKRYEFTPCSSSQAHSIGYSAPRKCESAALIEKVDGDYLLQITIETKSVPSAHLKRKLEERCSHIEKTEGRRPGRQFQRELKEGLLLSLLPQAFPKRQFVNVWFNTCDKYLILNSTSPAQVGHVVTLLIKTFEGLVITDLQTKVSPHAHMQDWLMDEPPTNWTIDMDSVLKSEGNVKSMLRYSNHPLDTPEIKQHLSSGLTPSELSLTYADRVSVTLISNLKLKKIRLLDNVFEQESINSEDAFDADAHIYIKTLTPMIKSLINALGGEWS